MEMAKSFLIFNVYFCVDQVYFYRIYLETIYIVPYNICIPFLYRTNYCLKSDQIYFDKYLLSFCLLS